MLLRVPWQMFQLQMIFQNMTPQQIAGKRLLTSPARLEASLLGPPITAWHTIFSEKHFLAANWQLVLSRTLGVDFVLSGLGTKTHVGELTGLHKTSVAATKIYFYFYYGIPLVLGYHINAWFYVLIVPILLLKMFKEYSRAKNAYYQRWLNVVSKP